MGHLVLIICFIGRTVYANVESHLGKATITRDDWGIAHVVGDTDADVVFGTVYAQAEDDFDRIERNYLVALGRLSEAEGESQIWSDLRAKLFVNEDELKHLYRESPLWLQRLMQAFADGLNYYLKTHPDVHPQVITHFEPWMALSFTEGSIGGDVERIDLDALRKFYGGDTRKAHMTPKVLEPSGSNGIAIAPQKSVSGNALLLINPHTTFYFRSELQMTSKEGLNAYGAVTWGQFFIYQGFNERLGWMHTSSMVDAVDEFLFPAKMTMKRKTVQVRYKAPTGMKVRSFVTYHSPRGPIVREQDGKWVSVRLMYDPINALTQSFLRTKARNMDAYKKVMELRANSSNNTVYADADGNIAFFYANFVPKRDAQFDWTKPVSGIDKRSNWKGVLSFKELPNAENPPTHFVFNTNNSPWSSGGVASPKKADYPPYIDEGSENARGVHALRFLQAKEKFDLDGLRALAFDTYLTGLEEPLSKLFEAYDALSASDHQRLVLREPIDTLLAWDRRWGGNSVATTIAVTWAEKLSSEKDALKALQMSVDELQRNFGSWRVKWGDINRLQRSGKIVEEFSDEKASLAIPFAPGVLGSLAAFAVNPNSTTKKRYGIKGNTFVAVVEFGKKVKAKAITVGGASGHPESKHFNDQNERYASGDLRDVYFYPEDLKGHIEKVYSIGR